ncbi:MAG: hypothetical protein ACFB21_09010 [Opitutales bacterium]
MYEPFNLNDYLGQLSVLAILGQVALIALAMVVYRRHLEKQEASWKGRG